MRNQAQLDAAVAAIERGWSVFPLAAGRKLPALHGADRCPRTGDCHDGHRTPEQRAVSHLTDHDRELWAARGWNVAIATGPSGLLVVDLDVPKPDDKPRPDAWNLPGIREGLDVFVAVCKQAGQPVPWDTYTVRTPSGGTHFYFLAPDGVELRNTGGDRGRGLGWKVDTRAWGGHVVAAGSVVDGHAYTVENDRAPRPLPQWLCERLLPAPLPNVPAAPVSQLPGRRGAFLAAAVRGEVERVRSATSERNWALYLAAVALGQLVAGGSLSEQDVRAELINAAAGHIAADPTFTERQAHLTITSGLRAGAKRPRRVA
ncbi:MAG: bifunctional DNA primase/polymerase [Actinophytocola sp.]|uniref:bifunctional DNA primase/polymerase n=1 Tax=Actinophytocola sp. TaxID=1872138 RepID=UPI003D6C4DE2